MHRAATGPIRRIRPEARKAAAAAFLGAISVAMLGIVASAGPPQAHPTSGTSAERPSGGGAVEIQMLGVNDFHGRLESPKALPRKPGEDPVALGAAAALDAHLDRAARSPPGAPSACTPATWSAPPPSSPATSTTSPPSAP